MHVVSIQILIVLFVPIMSNSNARKNKNMVVSQAVKLATQAFVSEYNQKKVATRRAVEDLLSEKRSRQENSFFLP